MASSIASITFKPKHSFGYKVKHSYMECQVGMADYKAMLKKGSDKDEKNRLELAERLRYVLAKRGMKAKVARACEVTEQAVSGWCRTGRVDKTHLPIIARITGFRLEWLLTGQGPMREGEGAPATRQASENLPSEDARFLDRVTEELKKRDVPEHIKETIITLLTTSQEKEKR